MASCLEDLSKAVAEIRSDLVCQICGDFARPGKRQWYRCLNMHQICQKCKTISEENGKCSCGQTISNEYCKMTEKWLSVKGQKFNCINTKLGCRETMDEDALEEHESECIYRSVPCPVGLERAFGGSVVTFQDVVQILEKSKEGVADGEMKIFKVSEDWLCGNDGWHIPIRYGVNQRMFILCGFVKDGTMYRWIHIIGTRNEAKHFSYTYKHVGENSTNTFEGKVAAIDDTFEDIFAAGKCFAYPHKAFVSQFVDENLEFKVSLKIRNLKEEVKDENYESGISEDDDENDDSK